MIFRSVVELLLEAHPTAEQITQAATQIREASQLLPPQAVGAWYRLLSDPRSPTSAAPVVAQLNRALGIQAPGMTIPRQPPNAATELMPAASSQNLNVRISEVPTTHGAPPAAGQSSGPEIRRAPRDPRVFDIGELGKAYTNARTSTARHRVIMDHFLDLDALPNDPQARQARIEGFARHVKAVAPTGADKAEAYILGRLAKALRSRRASNDRSLLSDQAALNAMRGLAGPDIAVDWITKLQAMQGRFPPDQATATELTILEVSIANWCASQ